MLPRSLFLIVVASCWLQINAVPFQSRDDYQDLQDDGEDLLDYAFADNDGIETADDNEGSGGAEGAEGAESSDGNDVTEGTVETSDKTSILETIKDTMETMDKLGVLKDKHNINVNANSPKHKKKTKKSRTLTRKRSRQKISDNEVSRRSTQQFPKTTSENSQIINERKRNIAGVKSRNHCNDARRSILNNYSQTINLNSSYLGIDEDFTIKSQAKMKKTHTVFTDDYITLCWIETTTIKEDRSVNPPKRLVLRDFTITFENAAAIPDEYLSCPEVDGDITMESAEAVCNTSLGENIADDTRPSRIVNLTKSIREDNLDIQINKVIKCAMGSVITKDVYRWLNPTESTRQRVEIKVSPETYGTRKLCTKYQHEPKLDNLLPKNESAECSDESEEDKIKDGKELGKNITDCSGESCSDEGLIVALPKPSDVSANHGAPFPTNELSTGKLKDTVTQPSDISLMVDKLSTKKPLLDPKTGEPVSSSSDHPGVDAHLPMKPLFDPKTGEEASGPANQPGINVHLPVKPLRDPKTGESVLGPANQPGINAHLPVKPLRDPKTGEPVSGPSDHPGIDAHSPTRNPLFDSKTGESVSGPANHSGIGVHLPVKPLLDPKTGEPMSSPSDHPGIDAHLPKKPSFDLKTGEPMSPGPSGYPGIIDHSPITKPSFAPKTVDIIPHPSKHPEIHDELATKRPLFDPKTGESMSGPSGYPGKNDHLLTTKPLSVLKPGDTVSHKPVYSGLDDKLLTTQSPNIPELIESLLSGITPSSSATKDPKMLSPIGHELNPSQQPLDIPCVGPNCPTNIPGKLPNSGTNIGKDGTHNITSASDEEPCDGPVCEYIEPISGLEMGENSDLQHEGINGTDRSDEFMQKEKGELYIPRPFICPVKNKQICDHLERISKLQGMEKSSEEGVDELAKELNKLSESNETSSIEGEGVELGDFVPVSSAPPTVKPGLSHTVSTMPLLKPANVKYVTLVDKSEPGKSHGVDSRDSESISSSEITSNELKSILSSEEDTSWGSATKHPEISLNQTVKVADVSSGEDSQMLSKELEKHYGSNETELNESCDESGNCHQSNTSYISRISSPPSPTVSGDGQVTPLMKDSQTKSMLGLNDGGEGDEDESCDCDEESDESKRCDPESGTCEPESLQPGNVKLVTPPMLGDESAKSHSLENMTTVSGRQGPTSSTMIENDRVKGVGTAAEKLLRNHKLSLKIHVTLEHIDEDKEKYELAQVEKDVLLNELPEQHGNHSLYWHIRALNNSANDVESLRDLFNCSILEKLTEEAIIDRLNATEPTDRMARDESYSKRRRRSVENVTVTMTSNNNNESSIGSSVIKDCILPNIREDIKVGLADMLDHILAALNNTKNNTSGKSDDGSAAPVKGDADATELSRSASVPNRNKRSLMNNSDGNKVEELSRWSNERFTPSNDGGQLRSFTELKIFQNPVGVN